MSTTIESFDINTLKKAMEHLMRENPTDETLRIVQIMRTVILTDESVSEATKEQFETLYTKFKFYHAFLE